MRAYRTISGSRIILNEWKLNRPIAWEIELPPFRIIEICLRHFEIAHLGEESEPLPNANLQPKSKSNCSRGARAETTGVEL
jgi:hypothetical protein